MSVHTPGEWTLVQPDQWPFDLEIRGPGGEEVFVQRRWAHASGQKTLADCLSAVGFHGDEGRHVRAVLATQVANAVLISCAPEMAKMILNLVHALDAQAAGADWLQPKIDKTRDAAIALWARATNAPPVSDGAAHSTPSPINKGPETAPKGGDE
jgi:hypothetical protein